MERLSQLLAAAAFAVVAVIVPLIGLTGSVYGVVYVYGFCGPFLPWAFSLLVAGLASAVGLLAVGALCFYVSRPLLAMAR